MQWETTFKLEYWRDRERRDRERRQMSSNRNQPSAPGQETVHPALTDDNINIPVTPSVSNESHAPLNTGSSMARNPPAHVLESIGANGQPEYVGDAASQHPKSGLAAANGTSTTDDVLRRLSLTGALSDADYTSIDPSTAHPGLGLSGSIISATFCVPHKISYSTSGEWVSCTDQQS